MVAPLCLLLFGIVVYGYLMSFRQNYTQGAAEGARAGAIAPPDASPTSHTIAYSQATVATRQALQSFGKDCDNVSTTCVVTVDDCATTTTPPPVTPLKCITVRVTYDYEHHPLMPDIPLVANAIPSTFVSTSTAQINQ